MVRMMIPFSCLDERRRETPCLRAVWHQGRAHCFSKNKSMNADDKNSVNREGKASII